MREDAWFRRSTWTELDRAEFDTRLYLSPSGIHRAQYLRIQAAHLAEAGLDAAAVELLNRMIVEYPDPLQLGQALLQKAESLGKLEQVEDAVRAYRDAVQAERDDPHVRTRAWLEFGRFVVGRNLTNLLPEVSDVVLEFRDE